jgi:hypothetical protein
MAVKMAGSMAAKPRSETKNADDPRGQFGKFLRWWIDRHHGGDLGPLAQSLDVSERTIGKWAEGAHSPALQDFDRVAKALGMADWGELARAVVRFNKK